MTIKAPKIDRRSVAELVDRVEYLAEHYTRVSAVPTWQPGLNGEVDVGSALIKIFARMTGQLIERLNQVPEKNFLAFLDLIGVRMAAPRPSRVPLTFAMSASSTSSPIVPQGTMASAPPGTGDDEEIIFETERELVLSPSMPVAAFYRNPAQDEWGDVSRLLSNTISTSAALFAVDRHIVHRLYLSQADIFSLPGPKKIIIIWESDDAPALSNLPLQWSCWDGEFWQVLSPALELSDDSCLKITLTDPPVPAPKPINHKNAPWICAELKKPLHQIDRLPLVNRISVRYEAGERGLQPEFMFTDALPLDPGKDFFPFGEQPGFNATFYIGSHRAFSRKNASIIIPIKLTNAVDKNAIPPPAGPSLELRLAWEFWNAHKAQWDFLGDSGPGAGRSPRYNFEDKTRAFTEESTIEFTCPPEIGPVEVNGQPGYWIRARIVAGDYGKPTGTRKVEATLKPNIFRKLKIPMYEVVPATYRPPSVQSIAIDYTHASSPIAFDAVVSENDFSFEDHHPASASETTSFRPYSPGREKYPALYLGFDKPFGNQPVTLYAGINEKALDQYSPATAELIWEYSSRAPDGWTGLWVEDETRGFTETGLIRFIAPVDITPHQDFEGEFYWLRVRPKDTGAGFLARLRCLLINTTWASQFNTIQNEILGASTGEPDQVFQFMFAPVLNDPQISVREPGEPEAIRSETRHADRGSGGIISAPETGDRQGTTWKQWIEVPNFFGSGPRDRHFVIDQLTGEVRFGDGQQGLIPPRDHANIRATQYRTGGGERGNLPAGTITQLKRTIPYVDGVINYEASGGGTDQQSLANVKRYGPRTLRHRNRAVTLQDFEDLIYSAFPDVARATVITQHFEPAGPRGIVTEINSNTAPVDIIVVPRSGDPRPEPGRGLENQVHKYLASRCAPTVRLRISGADWVKVSVEARISPVSLQMAGNIAQRVIDALKGFLHPLQGGFDGRGWEFGRVPYRSDLYALIESIDGVDHVELLQITVNPKFDLIPVERLQRVLIFSGDHRVVVVPPEEGA